MTRSEIPPADLRARVLAAAARCSCAPRLTWRRRVTLIGLSATAWLLLAVAASGIRRDWSELPAPVLTAMPAALALVAGLAWAVGLSRGRAMVGAATESLHAATWGLLLALHALVLALDPRGPSTVTFSGLWSTVAHAGPCFLRTVVVALPLLGLAPVALRGLTLARPFLVGSCFGLGSATWAHAVVWLHCPIGGPAHALIGHLLPAIPMVVAGAWIVWAADRRSLVRSITRRDQPIRG